MKTRTGFVSNSSSSSFIAYGATTTLPESLEVIELFAPGKVFAIASEKLNNYHTKNTADFVSITEDDERFRQLLSESLVNGWPVEYYDLFESIDLPIPLEHLYEDEKVLIGYSVDTEYQWGIEKVIGGTFSHDKIEKTRVILETVNITPEFIIGRKCS